MDLLPCLRSTGEGVLLEVHVQPRASRNELAGLHEGVLKVRLTAPPVEGEANRECMKLIGKVLGVPRSDIDIVRGGKSRRKTVSIRGLSVEIVNGLLREKGIS